MRLHIPDDFKNMPIWKIQVDGMIECLDQRINAINVTSSSSPFPLNDLTDVDTTGVISGKVLKYNGTFWIDDTDLTGGSSITHLDNLTDVVIVSPATNQIFTYNGTHWVNDSTITLIGTMDANSQTIDDFGTLISSGNNPATSGDIRLSNGETIVWREFYEASNSFIDVTSDEVDDYFHIFIDGNSYFFDEDKLDLFFNDLVNVNDLLLNDQDGTPIADRQFRVIDGEIRSTTTSDTEGRFISKDSIELGLYENNTASNLGVSSSLSEGIFAQKSGVDLQFKRLLESSGITLSSNGTHITITNALPESTVCTNVGSGKQVYKDGNCNFRTLTNTSRVWTVQNTNDILLDSTLKAHDSSSTVYQTVTKTNIGTAYVDVYTTLFDMEELVIIDFYNYTYCKANFLWDYVGTGTQQVRWVDQTNNANVLIESATFTTDQTQTSTSYVAVPSWAKSGTGVKVIEWQGKSTVAGDDPIARGYHIICK